MKKNETKKLSAFFILIIILFLSVPLCQAQETAIKSADKKRPFIAAAETLLTNVFFTGVTGYIFNFSWARPTTQSIYDNFTLPWQWEDTDGFKVNQIGHPYQGSLYFNAGRANGFNFYEALLFTSMGSITWEIFGERQGVGVNDLITTTFASPSLGEMLHRLYLEAYKAGIPMPFRVFISPMDALNQLVTGKPPASIHSAMYELSFFAGLNYAQTRVFTQPEKTQLFSFSGFTGSAGVRAVYGNPFEQQSIIPYEHFDLKISLGMNMGNHIDIRVISDGYLFSFSPINTKQDRLSTGLTLHFDFVSLGEFSIADSSIDQYSNAVDWSIKYQHLFQNALTAALKLHAGFTFLGVSEYFSPHTEDKTLKNYGGGINVKFSFDLEKEKLGRFSLDINQYVLWSFTELLPFSAGNVFCIFADAAYSYPVSEHISLGIGNSFAFEYALFDGFPDTRKWSNTIHTFVKWSL